MKTRLDWMDLHVRVLFPHTREGLLKNISESARFYLGRTPDGNLWRVRSDVPWDIANRLKALACGEPVSENPQRSPVHADAYISILEEFGPVERCWCGPAYRFPVQIPTHPYQVVQIDNGNIDLLRHRHVDWLQDVGIRDPVCVLLIEGEVVSVCFSPVMSDVAYEAGVETLESHRGRGYAVAVVASWARAVRELGIEPLYSTSLDNLASQGVAAKLGLIKIGMDFHIT